MTARLNPIRRRNRRQSLMLHQCGKCHWCGCEMVLMERHVSHPPDNMATLDHLDDRLSGSREGDGGDRIVLACYGCNFRRGRETHFETQQIRELVMNIAVSKCAELGYGTERRDLFTDARCMEVFTNMLRINRKEKSRLGEVCRRMLSCVGYARKQLEAKPR